MKFVSDKTETEEKLRGEWNGSAPPFGYCDGVKKIDKSYGRKLIVKEIPFRDITTRIKLIGSINSLKRIGGKTLLWSALEESKKVFLTKQLGSRYDDNSVPKVVFILTNSINSSIDPKRDTFMASKR